MHDPLAEFGAQPSGDRRLGLNGKQRPRPACHAVQPAQAGDPPAPARSLQQAIFQRYDELHTARVALAASPALELRRAGPGGEEGM